MNGNSHFTFGAATGFLATELMIKAYNNHYFDALNELDNIGFAPVGVLDPKTTAAAVFGLALIGSIFPDIDSPKSSFGKLTYPVSKWISGIGASAGHKYERHRWIMHDAGFYLLIMLALAPLGWLIPLVGFFVGVYSHLFLDAFNPAGVRFFGKFVRYSKVPANSKMAKIVTSVCSVTVVITGVAVMLLM